MVSHDFGRKEGELFTKSKKEKYEENVNDGFFLINPIEQIRINRNLSCIAFDMLCSADKW